MYKIIKIIFYVLLLSYFSLIFEFFISLLFVNYYISDYLMFYIVFFHYYFSFIFVLIIFNKFNL